MTTTKYSVYRHKKRGTEYAVIGIGFMQSAEWESPIYDEGGYLGGATLDMREVVVYRSLADGVLWVRPREEFEDGRFEVLEGEA